MSGISGCPFLLWGLLAFFGLALVISLIFNISHYVEKQQQDKMYRYCDDYIPRAEEYYVEDTPIYGNLDNIIPAMDEDCYEQMKARPQRSASDTQEAPTSGQGRAEDQMCYATLDHSFKGKRRRPRKQNANLLDREKDAQVCAMDANISQINLVENSPPDNQAVEESVHDDPARLFGLIRAKREPAI
ncbi:T-cell receptor-associated transmembrane adapter 1 isoform X2 [Peromyscus leucopus]|uniref:T-cell receptor-associated transmembrane adapter 1 isoform X2 n=1 Tax=Peromyscus leucopus TaxID=10041 RepID=UPI0010A18FA1|nr:T-cell receptor-associated transmembrane adapter 1 isoform X2 [Peromyscus leucopus]